MQHHSESQRRNLLAVTLSLVLVCALALTMSVLSEQLAILAAIGTVASMLVIVGAQCVGIRGLMIISVYLSSFLLPLSTFRITSSISVADAFLLLGAALLFLQLPMRPTAFAFPPLRIFLQGAVLLLVGVLPGSFLSDRPVASLLILVKLGIASLLLPILKWRIWGIIRIITIDGGG